MGLLGLYMGKVTRVRKKLVGSAVFLKLVPPLLISNPVYIVQLYNSMNNLFLLLRSNVYILNFHVFFLSQWTN